MKHYTKLLVCYKLFFGLLGFSALVTEIATLVATGRFRASDFFSYFTVECNMVVVAALLLRGIAVAAGKNEKLAFYRGAATVYILIVGLGFSVLLSGIKDAEFTAAPWDNVVLHYIMPVAMLVDYLLDRPATKLSFRRSLWWLVFPLGYVIYSLVRGSIVHWYPYPFLNPYHRGTGFVVVVVVGLSVLTVCLNWLVTKLSGRPNRAQTA